MTSDLKQNVYKYKEYDPQFTADISKKMQMPDRLVPGGGFHEMDAYASANHQSSYLNYKDRVTANYDLPLSKLPFEESHYMLATPPSRLTNFGGTTLADDEDDNSDSELEKVRRSLWENMPKSPKYSRLNSISKAHRDYFLADVDEGNEEVSLPMTPGTMLLMQKGDKLAALQRQVGKLAYRVSKLQDENRRRKACEWILYPLVIGYVFIQIGKFVFSKPY
ncbi:hypothetical protein HELRODRAFT_164357 [Helobdella robusta]|uniref:Mitochondrial fission factor n=1 Tax=Helobdella robusta TaxID=6412 RepID=T1EVB3_HELRO|nr:hypothetical protein HELRODRAFT_164357 [Helobdella robusta]ESN94500.1 hypothetical protein HELRODRAFT_164357 [Helobdella robusta]